jgi:predicted RNase H-like HicB family nuclease
MKSKTNSRIVQGNPYAGKNITSITLEGFTGLGHSIEDCVYKAKWGMKEHMELLKERGLPVPSKVKNPKIIVQNEEKLAA